MSPEIQVPLELIRFKLSLEDIELLQEHKAEWQAANRTDRQSIATRVYGALKKRNPLWTEEDRKLKKEVCFTTTFRRIKLFKTGPGNIHMVPYLWTETGIR
jgi:hypothetical protein